MSAPSPPFVLRKASKFTLFTAPFVIIGGLWATPGLMVYDALKTGPAAPVVAAAPDGQRLFVQHCASCHGETGDGKGTANLDPPARHFGYQPFKFATTLRRQEAGYAFANPSDADLLDVLKRGIPGSAMPAFQKPPEGTSAAQVRAELTDAELAAVVGHVRELTRKGVYEKLLAVATIKELKDITAEDDEAGAIHAATKVDWKEARKAADKPAKLTPATDLLTVAGKPLVIPPVFPPASPNALTNGKALFVKATCASCHGLEGKGDGEQFKEPEPGQPDKRPKNLDGTPASPRDLTAGIYKGGGDAKSLYARIRLGIPGTPMPASEASALPDPDMTDLIRYVQSLKGR